MAGKIWRQTIASEHAGEALGSYLKKVCGFTGAQIRSMKFRPDGIRVNGQRVRVNTVLGAGDELELCLEAEGRVSDHLAGWQMPGNTDSGQLRILYEDEDLIAVWKKAGQVTHPAHGHYADTLSNLLHTYFEEKGEKAVIRSIGRLDKDTSGIVVFSKNRVAAQRLWRQKEQGVFRKEYLALCEGIFPDECRERKEKRITDRVWETWAIDSPGVRLLFDAGENECIEAIRGDACAVSVGENWRKIDAPIAPVPSELMKMCVSAEGKPAVTYYQVLEQYETCALLCVRIVTGRTHQIRVHMASIGHPLVGDALYGNGTTDCGSQGDYGILYDNCFGDSSGARLCAWKAWLRQPFTGEEIRIASLRNLP